MRPLINRPASPGRRRVIAGTAALLGGAALAGSAIAGPLVAGAQGRPAPAAPAPLRGAAATRTMQAPAFGAVWRLTLPAGQAGERIFALLQDELDRLDRALSPWRADSALTRLNRAGAGAQAVPPDVSRVAAAALGLARASGGAFDPSVGPLVARWGFGPISTGSPGLEGMRATPGVVEKSGPGQTLDPCGIAKGHAIDRLAAALDAKGYPDYLLDLGGELIARGRHPSGRGWQVAVEDPRPGRDEAAEVLALDGRAVATSGDRVNAYMIGAKRVSHIIDPASGRPASGGVASVTVVAEDGITADGWATALMAAGPERGLALAAEHRLAALFLVHAPGGGLRRSDSAAMAAYLAEVS